MSLDAEPVLDRAVEASGRASVYEDAIVWDNHVCLPLPAGGSEASLLERHRRSGVTFVSVNLGDADASLESMLRAAATFRRWIASAPESYVLATTPADVLAAKQSGRLAVAFDVEGGRVIGEDLAVAGLLYDIGVRWILMVFNKASPLGGGCHDTHDPGLSRIGAALLQELERVGIVACCTHTGYRTARDVLARATRPVIFSHSNARALHDHPRNIPDELIRECARTGGVVGINGLDIFLGRSGTLVERFAAHVDHMVQLVGPAHVGIGLDFVHDQDGLDRALAASRDTWPKGYGYEPGIRFLPPEALPEVADRLSRLGYADTDVRAILGGNFLRVAQLTWR